MKIVLILWICSVFPKGRSGVIIVSAWLMTKIDKINKGWVAKVRVKSILKSVRDVRACGSFLGVRCATLLLHTFGTKLPENAILERLISIQNIFSCFRTSFPDLERLIMFLNTRKMLKNVEKLLKNSCKNIEKLLKLFWKNVNLPKRRVWSATTSNWRCAHLCVRN